VGRFDALARDHKRIGAAKVGSGAREGVLHAAPRAIFGKIGYRLGLKCRKHCGPLLN
jgi:hypothetical protein